MRGAALHTHVITDGRKMDVISAVLLFELLLLASAVVWQSECSTVSCRLCSKQHQQD